MPLVCVNVTGFPSLRNQKKKICTMLLLLYVLLSKKLIRSFHIMSFSEGRVHSFNFGSRCALPPSFCDLFQRRVLVACPCWSELALRIVLWTLNHAFPEFAMRDGVAFVLATHHARVDSPFTVQPCGGKQPVQHEFGCFKGIVSMVFTTLLPRKHSKYIFHSSGEHVSEVNIYNCFSPPCS